MRLNHNRSVPVRVVVVDDHEHVRLGVAQMLNAEPGLEVVGQAGTAAEARDVIAELVPTVAVLDLSLPDGSGAELLKHFAAEMTELVCIIHTGTLQDGQADLLLDAGAAAVVLKSLRGTDLLDAVRQAGERAVGHIPTE